MHRNHALLLFGAAIAAAGALPAGAAEGKPALTLVADGQAKAVVVVADKPSPAAEVGAKILSDHLFQISGARLEVRREGELGDVQVDAGRLRSAASKGDAFVLVGESEAARRLGVTAEGLGPGGIVVHTVGNALVLLGADERTPSDPNGTQYAVTTFLEDTLGCRYLWPGELGKVVPRLKSVSVPALDVRVTPLLVQRKIRNMRHNDRLQAGLDRLRLTQKDYESRRAAAEVTQSESGGWFAWQRLGGDLMFPTGHAFGTLWEKYGKEHPEWFALQANGSRDQTAVRERARLCKSNLELIEQIARDKIEELNQKPENRGVSLSPNDGGRHTFCMCPECKKLDAPEGRKIALWAYSAEGRKEFEYVSLTDRMVWFWNAIAERVTKVHPNALFGVDAYSAYSAPPVHRALHPNLVVRFVPVNYLSDKLRQQGREDWDAWAAKARKLFWRPNLLLAGRFEGTTVAYPHKMAEDFRYLAHHSMFATDFDSCVHNWAVQGLNYYVNARLQWNPDLDVAVVIDDYCRAGFGPAAGEVKRYLARVEELTNQTAAGDLGVTDPYTPEVLSELRALLDAAAKAAVGDAQAGKRVAFLRTGFDFTALQADLYRMLKQAADNPAAVDKAEAAKLLDRKFLMMRDIFRKNHLAVNVGYLCWAEWARFRPLGWTAPSNETVQRADEEPE